MASQGGNFAVLAALSTHPPLGVPANLPVTDADATRPPFDTEMVTFAIPGPCTDCSTPSPWAGLPSSH